MKIFDFLDYKDVLCAKVQANRETRGYLSRLAEAARCQKSYLSQVLNAHVHFTPEHAVGVAKFWSLNEAETEFFLALVDLGRTDHPDLKKRIKKRLAAIRNAQEEFVKRYSSGQMPTLEMQALYYSSWLPTAVHMLVSQPQLQRADKLASHLRLPERVVKKTLEELKRMGLVSRHDDMWKYKGENIHLGKNSPLLAVHHSNWRERAIVDARDPEHEGFHYTGVQTLSLSDFEKIKTLLVEAIDRQRHVVSSSKEEVGACLAVDWFQI